MPIIANKNDTFTALPGHSLFHAALKNRVFPFTPQQIEFQLTYFINLPLNNKNVDKKYHFGYITTMTELFHLKVVFYKTKTGHEPVREWLQDLTRAEKKIIGEDIKVIQFGWPLGMPLIRKVENDLWEIRSHLKNRTA